MASLSSYLGIITSTLAPDSRPWGGAKERRDTVARGEMEPRERGRSRRGSTVTTTMDDSGRRRAPDLVWSSYASPHHSAPPQARSALVMTAPYVASCSSIFPSTAPVTTTRSRGGGRSPAWPLPLLPYLLLLYHRSWRACRGGLHGDSHHVDAPVHDQHPHRPLGSRWQGTVRARIIWQGEHLPHRFGLGGHPLQRA